MLVTNPPAEVTPNLLMLATKQYPLFLYRGDGEGTLFEGGVGAMGPLLLEQFAALGIGHDFVKQIVVTHAHPDHVMAVPLLRQAFPAAKVLASDAAAKTLSIEKAVGFFSKVDGAFTEALLKVGAIAGQHRPQPLAEMRIAVDRVIKEGDSIPAGAGAAFSVLETPGHSDCSLSFYEPQGKLLIISDATGYYLSDRNLWWPNYFTGYGAYLRSIERLAGLGADVICLSHNCAITGADDIAAYFRDALAATQTYHRRIIEAVKGGKTPQQIAEELGAEAHQSIGLLAPDFFVKNCAILVKQSLKHEGIEPR